MEFQHRNCLEFLNANSKSDWIEQLIQFGSRYKEEIIFYLHRLIFKMARLKKDFQTRLIEYFSSKHSYPCQIIDNRDTRTSDSLRGLLWLLVHLGQLPLNSRHFWNIINFKLLYTCKSLWFDDYFRFVCIIS